MSVYAGSRYLETKLNTFRGQTPLLEIRKPVVFGPEKCDTYIFKRGDRVDGIAYQVYNNAQLAWAIMDANPKYFSELEVQIGDVLFIPHYQEVVKHCGL